MKLRVFSGLVSGVNMNGHKGATKYLNANWPLGHNKDNKRKLQEHGSTQASYSLVLHDWLCLWRFNGRGGCVDRTLTLTRGRVGRRKDLHCAFIWKDCDFVVAVSTEVVAIVAHLHAVGQKGADDATEETTTNGSHTVNN
jgi:hypothetical protein